MMSFIATAQLIPALWKVLSGIRLIKYYAWETFYAHQVNELREREARAIRRFA